MVVAYILDLEAAIPFCTENMTDSSSFFSDENFAGYQSCIVNTAFASLSL